MTRQTRPSNWRTNQIVVAQREDIPAWLSLAAEIEALFGSMVGEPGFQRALQKNIERGTALCVREVGGLSGALLQGGLLDSPKPPCYTIGWLAVARSHRRQGIEQMLVRRVIDLAQIPAEFVITTFSILCSEIRNFAGSAHKDSGVQNGESIAKETRLICCSNIPT